MIEGQTCWVGTADFALSLIIELVLLARYHYIIHCFAGVVGAR